MKLVRVEFKREYTSLNEKLKKLKVKKLKSKDLGKGSVRIFSACHCKKSLVIN